MKTFLSAKGWTGAFGAAAVLFLSFAGPLAVGAQEGNGPVITDITVSGLRRTRESVPVKLLDRYIGTPAAAVDKNAVIATLLDTGIFENIQVDTVPAENSGEHVLTVAVDEKWSIIGLPVFVASSEGITAGAALMDANAFGLNDKLFAVGLFLPGGWMSSVAYMNVPSNPQSFGWSVSTFFSRQDTSNVDENDKDIRRFGFDALAGAVELSIPLPGALDGSVGTGIQSREVRDIDDALAQPESAASLGIWTGISARTSSWDGVLLSERQFQIRYSYNYGLENDSFHGINLRASYEHPFFPGLKAAVKGAAEYQPEAPVVFEGRPENVGINILPASYSAALLAGGSLGIEGRLIQFPFAVLTGLLSYQGVYTDGPVLGSRMDHGPTGGIRLYLAKVAIPAMDFGIAYNVEADLFRATFGIGMRM